MCCRKLVDKGQRTMDNSIAGEHKIKKAVFDDSLFYWRF